VVVTTIGVSIVSYLALIVNLLFSIEKQLEDEEALEQNLNKDKDKKFKDEDEVDSEDERKKKQEELK
jgi:hypothetical protein